MAGGVFVFVFLYLFHDSREMWWKVEKSGVGGCSRRRYITGGASRKGPPWRSPEHSPSSSSSSIQYKRQLFGIQARRPPKNLFLYGHCPFSGGGRPLPSVQVVLYQCLCLKGGYFDQHAIVSVLFLVIFILITIKVIIIIIIIILIFTII